MPEVTVMMPVYQMAGNPALRTAVRSIEKQTFADWELLLYDDGSTDGTLQELRRLAARHPRIFVICGQENRGAGYARNICIQAASGRYLAVMDADDIAHPRRLEIQKDFLDSNPQYAFAGSHAWMIDSRGIWGLCRTKKEPDAESFLHTLPVVHPSVMFRKEVLIHMHGYAVSPKTRRAEDYELLMRLYAAGYRGYNIQRPLLSYREDLRAYHKRKYRYRIAECMIRLEGFQRLGILRGNMRYVIKPLAVGLVPAFVMRAVRSRRFRWDAALQERDLSRREDEQR
ncbi:MAG: glycosyltransferase family 2 protein [Eubacterium sp.]|nr:glycosyltransferase family 2 protein [Eubacterium sp.]